MQAFFSGIVFNPDLNVGDEISPCLYAAMMQRPDFAVSLSQLINQAGLADILPTTPASYYHGDHAAVAATVPPETRDHCTYNVVFFA